MIYETTIANEGELTIIYICEICFKRFRAKEKCSDHEYKEHWHKPKKGS